MKKGLIILMMMLVMMGAATEGFADGKNQNGRRKAGGLTQKRNVRVAAGDVTGDGRAEFRRRNMKDGASNTLMLNRNGKRINGITFNAGGGNDKISKSNR